MRLNLNPVIKSICTIFCIVFVLSGCNNDMKEVNRITKTDSLPDQQGTNIKMVYTEFGKTVFILRSPELEVYKNEENPRTIFPKGVDIVFYDSAFNEISTISADYTIQYDKEDKVIAKRNVVIKNLEKDEQLNTEELIWNRKTKKIYTDKFVTIITGNQVLYGEEGMEADENFNKWTINKLKGNVEIEE